MGKAHSRTLRSLAAALVLCLSLAATSLAQDTTLLGQLFLTGSDTDSYPSVQLRAYGMDGQGNPIDFSTAPLVVTHNDFPADEVRYEGSQTVGTLTVFLIDAPSGVSAQIPAIQDAIRQFASPGNMQEQTDYVAVYQIGPDGPRELLGPTQFYNGVNNLFATSPIVPEEGLTALYDSTVALVDQIPALKPDPAMAASVVLLSDGTDAVSTAAAGEVPLQGAAAGVPIHTILLDNPELVEAGRLLGANYMRDVAVGSRGVAAQLSDPASLGAIWSRIGAFRDQALVRYVVPEPASGTFPVTIGIEGNPDLRASTEVSVDAALPAVVINLDRESRAITVPDLEDPIPLQLSTGVSWLDGQQREVTSAALYVNGAQEAEIPVDQLASFTVPVSNLAFGDNRLEVVVTDDQGLQSTSAPVIINVAQGEELVVPEELQPPSSGFSPIWLLLLLALITVLVYYLWRRRSAAAAGPAAAGASSRRRRRTSPEAYPPPGTPVPGVETTGEVDFLKTEIRDQKPFVMAHLEVIDSQTYMPDELTLGDVEVRIGRSPAQSNIAFRDDITVSRYHAVLRLEGNRYRIYDAGSTSGTYVNDRQVPEYGLQLADGDEIQLGAVRLRYRQL